MRIKFTKMQGCGNDYVYIDGFKEHIAQDKKSEVVIRLSDRHFGIGSDGVIFINPSVIADFEMEMYNADGSRAEMCGNGIRCVAKYVYDNGLTDKEQFTIESFGKIKYITVETETEEGAGGCAKKIVKSVTVDMGEPVLKAEDIPVKCEAYQDGMDAADAHIVGTDAEGRVIAQPITVKGRTFAMTCVSMGNPHAVVFTDTKDVDIYGPDFECAPEFPRRVNTEFVHVISRNEVDMRVYERGTGETLACGTGCCATCVACVLNGLTDREITVHVLGGDLRIKWDERDGHVYMTGPAAVSFTGEIDIW